jgi:hypothetical protein
MEIARLGISARTQQSLVPRDGLTPRFEVFESLRPSIMAKGSPGDSLRLARLTRRSALLAARPTPLVSPNPSSATAIPGVIDFDGKDVRCRRGAQRRVRSEAITRTARAEPMAGGHGQGGVAWIAGAARPARSVRRKVRGCADPRWRGSPARRGDGRCR